MSHRFVLSLVLTWMEEGGPDVVDADVNAASDAESDAASDTPSDTVEMWLEGYDDERVLVSANGGYLVSATAVADDFDPTDYGDGWAFRDALVIQTFMTLQRRYNLLQSLVRACLRRLAITRRRAAYSAYRLLADRRGQRGLRWLPPPAVAAAVAESLCAQYGQGDRTSRTYSSPLREATTSM